MESLELRLEFGEASRADSAEGEVVCDCGLGDRSVPLGVTREEEECFPGGWIPGFHQIPRGRRGVNRIPKDYKLSLHHAE